MPYNPGISYLTPADKSAQAMSAIGSAASAIGAGFQELRQTQEQNDFFTQRGRDLHSAGLMTEEQLKQFETGGLSKKKAIVADTLFNVEQGQQKQQLDFRYYQEEMDRQQHEAANAGKTMTADQLAQFEQRTGYTYVNGQVVPLKGGTGSADAANFPEIEVDGQKFKLIPKDLRPVGAKVGSSKPMGVAESSMVGNLTESIASIDNQIAEIAQSGDARGKRGPNWLPGRTRTEEITDLEAKRAGLHAQLEGLKAGRGGASAPAGADPVHSNLLQEARTAIQAGAPREAVIERLRKLGVDPGTL